MAAGPLEVPPPVLDDDHVVAVHVHVALAFVPAAALLGDREVEADPVAGDLGGQLDGVLLGDRETVSMPDVGIGDGVGRPEWHPVLHGRVVEAGP